MTERDGFRKRRLTPAQRRKVIAEKIKSGEVARPGEREPHRDYSGRDDVEVVEVPIAEGFGEAKER